MSNTTERDPKTFIPGEDGDPGYLWMRICTMTGRATYRVEGLAIDGSDMVLDPEIDDPADWSVEDFLHAATAVLGVPEEHQDKIEVL